ncbi:MAG: hypothetical protein QMC51_00785 [Alteromonadaceae bacterium]
MSKGSIIPVLPAYTFSGSRGDDKQVAVFITGYSGEDASAFANKST